MLACGTPDAVDRYRQAGQASHSPDGPGGKNFGSGRSSVRPWRRTIGRPRRDSGKPSGASEGGSSTLPTLFTVQGGELLTSTEDIVGRWKKYFEDLLNPTDLPSSEEAEAGDSEVDPSITQAEVTEVVRKLLGGKAPGVDEIRPEYLKSLDVVGLSWLTRLCNIAWRVLEGLWEFAQPVHMCFVDLEKAFDRVPRGILWGVLRHEYGVRGPLLRAVRSLYDRSRSLVRIAGSKSDLFPAYVARGRRESGLGTTGFHLCFFADDVVLLASSSSQDLQHVLERFAAECEAAGMRISTSKSEAMVGSRPEKGDACPHPGGEWRGPASSGGVQSSISGSCSRVRERWSVRLTGGLVHWCVVRSYVWSVYRTVVVKKELSRKAKLSIYRVNLRFPPSPMVMNFG
ncbi:hypothetical protein L3Q82_021824 [Scortum barcoo]|uniref:Uncharacterized protein n=1 Tax=Scortum barcoo TaxID=214431 RepID=A0ACB8X5I4_9TELE|nr:hypothetical protein L3Q82_021824 [Scortum barcoo]